MPRLLLLAFLLVSPAFLRAQDASLSEANLTFSRGVVEHHHFRAHVELKPPQGEKVGFVYDHYPQEGPFHGAERLKVEEGVFARHAGGTWLKSDDWAATGKPPDTALAAELNTYATIANIALQKPQNLDQSQGRNVWKFVGKTSSNGVDYYTYERSREHPHPDGIYPRFTFMKAVHDVDGKLFCVQATGQLRSGTDRVPFVINLVYLYPIPAGTQVNVFDQVTKKEKYHTVTDKDSSWEITSQQSAPPSAASPVPVDIHTTVQDFAPDPGNPTNAAPAPTVK
jgi:hypothetical protein